MTTDKDLIRERFEANFSEYNRLALVQQHICTELADDLTKVCAAETVRSALEIGVGTGFLTSRLTAAYPAAHWYLNDIAEGARAFVEPFTNGLQSTLLWNDAETLEFPARLDLVASASTMQWFDDVPRFIARAAEATLNGGYIALSSFGVENFKEIAATTGEGLQYYTRAELEHMLACNGYSVLSSRDYIKSLLFDSPLDVLHHIKATGVNSIRKAPWTRGRLTRFELDYRERFSIADSRVTLTYHPIIIVARRV